MPCAVRVGGTSKAELLRALRERGVRLNAAAETLFEDRRFTVLDEGRVIEIEIEIAAVSVGELGLNEGASYAQVTARALESGLVECPLELGPYLRMQFPDQPEADGGASTTRGRAPPGSITIASPPLDDTEGPPKGFYLRRAEGVSWLRGYWASPDHVWDPDRVLVFARRPARKGLPD